MLRVIFNPIQCPPTFFICNVCLLRRLLKALERTAGISAQVARSSSSSRLRRLARGTGAARLSEGLRAANMKRLRSIIGLNVLWKYCVSLFVSFLSPSLPPPPPPPPPSLLSPVLHLIHPICLGTVRHVVKFASPTARLPKYHCLILLLLQTREKKDVFTFSF